MSKPMTRPKPAMRAVSTAPTTPPAGPDRMASLPLNRCAEVSPPEDCMNRSLDAALACWTRAPRATPIDISAQQRREIGVDHGGVAAPDEFHERAHLVAHRDLREAHFVGEARSLSLVVRKSVGMHEDDGDGVDALGARGFERGARGGKIERRLDRAVGAHALRHLGDAHIEHRRLLDLYARRSSAAPDSRSRARRGTLCSPATARDRPCARAAHWWRRWCPS